jgi:hypothetical protein
MGRADETREAMGEIAGPADDALTARLRHAVDAVHDSNVRPLADSTDAETAERQWFATVMESVEAQQASKRPRRR